MTAIISTFKVIFIAVLLSFFTNNAAAENNVLYKHGKHFFTQKNVNELIELGEYLGRSEFTQKDKTALKNWSIIDYKSAPKESVKFYKALTNNVIKNIRNPATHSEYRSNLYLTFHDMFVKKTKAERRNDDFLNIINHYNPPIQEALYLRQIQAKLIQQQLQINQMMFNQSMKQSQAFSNMLQNEISNSSTKQSIRLSGGTVLYEDENHVFAKDAKGQRYQIAK